MPSRLCFGFYLFFCFGLIWKMRCDFVYRGIRPIPLYAIQTAVSQANEFKEANRVAALDTPTLGSPDCLHWSCPPMEIVKINCDAAWTSPLNGAVGVIIRNHEGQLLAGMTDKISAGNAEEAEATALLRGINLASTLHLGKIIMESDSQQTIMDLNSGGCKNWRSYQILNQIRSCGSTFESCAWNWVPRKANIAAHTATQLTFRGEGPLIWTNQPPLALVSVLRSDGLTGPPSF